MRNNDYFLLLKLNPYAFTRELHERKLIEVNTIDGDVIVKSPEITLNKRIIGKVLCCYIYYNGVKKIVCLKKLIFYWPQKNITRKIISHVNGNIHDCRKENLVIYGKKKYEEKNFTPRIKGERIGIKKFSYELAQKIRTEYASEKTSYRKLSFKYKVSRNSIYEIINNKIYL